jgi:hypothetical protein
MLELSSALSRSYQQALTRTMDCPLATLDKPAKPFDGEMRCVGGGRPRGTLASFRRRHVVALRTRILEPLPQASLGKSEGKQLYYNSYEVPSERMPTRLSAL